MTAPQQRTKVLIASSDAQFVAATVEVLAAADYEALSTTQGGECLGLCRRERPDLVLLDAVLADADGREVCRAVKSDPALADVFVVLVSGVEPSPGGTAREMDALADECLTRPLRPRELLARVRVADRLHATQRALRASEARFASLAELSPAGIYMTDAHGDFTYVSPRWCEMAGLSAEQAAGRGWTRGLDPKDRQRVTEDWYACVGAGEGWSDEYRFRMTSGKVMWVYGRARPMRDHWGRVTGYVGTTINITSRRLAEDALRMSEERYRGIVEDTPALLCSYLPDGTITFVNKAYCEYFGRTPEELVGATFLSLIPEADRFGVMDGLSTLTPGSPTQSHEHQVIGPDGEIRWQQWTNRAVFSERGEVVGYQGIGQDITERKRAEERVTHLNRVLRAILNVNEVVVRERDPQRLIQRACERLIETGGYYSAWIVLWGDAGQMAMAAEAGVGEAFSGLVAQLEAGTLPACAKQAMSEKAPVIVSVPASVCTGCPLSVGHAGRGGIVVRLEYGERAHGLLTLSAPLHLIDGSEEKALLQGVAADIALALHGIGTERRHRQAEAALRESEEKFRLLFELSADAHVLIVGEEFVDCNPACLDILGLSDRSELIGRTPADIAPAEQDDGRDSRESAKEMLALAYKHGSHRLEWACLRADGERLSLDILLNAITLQGRPAIHAVGRDVTENKRVEVERERQLRFQQALLDAMPAPVFYKDTSGRYLGVNRAFEEFFGATREALVGRTVYDVAPKELAEVYHRKDREILASPGTQIYECQVLDARGTLHDVVFHKATFQDEDENVAGLIGAVLDITQQKQAADALRRSGAILNETGRMAKIGGWEHDLITGQAVWTRELYSLAEIAPAERPPGVEEHLGYYPPEHRRILADAYTRAQKEHIPFDLELQVRTAGGKIIWCRVFGEPVVEAGRCVRMRGTCQDITELKRARAKVADLARFPAENPHPVLRVSADGTVMYANAPGQDLLASWGSGPGQPVPPTWREQVRDALATKAVWQAEAEYEGHTISFAGVPVLEGGYVNLYGRDVTRRKQIEAEREELIDELERRNEEMEWFVYTISHDLRSPLITIQGFAGQMIHAVESGELEDLPGDAQRVSRAAGRMQELLDQLLELSRIGRLMHPPERVELDSLAQDVLDALGGVIVDKGITIQQEPGLPAVFGDRVRLREVFQNLLENAAKFMGDQAEPRVEIGSRTDGDETVVYVRDNGMGIDPAYNGKIFGLFDKLDPASSGTGVGLSLVKRIVETHGGRIWVESEGTGHGATFCLTLPQQESADE